MTTYNEIKRQHQKEYDDAITKHQVFFAFSDEQFEEGKKKIGIADNKDLVSIGMGGFAPRKNVENFLADIAESNKVFKKALREAKEAKEQAILYELNNYEAFYNGNMDDVFESFKGIYTKEDIIKVYNKHKNDVKQCHNND